MFSYVCLFWLLIGYVSKLRKCKLLNLNPIDPICNSHCLGVYVNAFSGRQLNRYYNTLFGIVIKRSTIHMISNCLIIIARYHNTTFSGHQIRSSSTRQLYNLVTSVKNRETRKWPLQGWRASYYEGWYCWYCSD